MPEYTQEIINTMLNETIQDLRAELNKEIKILKRIQSEIKMELKNLTAQFKNLGGKP